jgi:hypothetical protein
MYVDKFISVQALKEYETCVKCSAPRTDRLFPVKPASNTLCLDSVHCPIFIQIHGKHNPRPTSCLNEFPCLVAHDVVSVA